MRSMVERSGPTLWTAVSILAALGIVSSLGAMAYRRTAPLDPVVVRSAASACRRDYVEARTAAESLATDQRIWHVDNRSWHRLPSCGELRAKNLLQPPMPQR